MNSGLSGLYSEAQCVVRKVLVSAENLQLTVRSDLTLEEYALHSHHNGCKLGNNTGYKISQCICALLDCSVIVYF